MMTIKHISFFFLIFFSLVIFNSCLKESNEAPDVSNIEVDIEVSRTENDLMVIDTMKSIENLQKLIDKDSSFYSIYFDYVLRVPLKQISEDQKRTFINGFVSDQRIKRLYHEIDSVYMGFDAEIKDFEQAFRFMKYYFPEKKAPHIYTYLSEFSLQRFLFDVNENQEGLAIGLDMFLGTDYPYDKYVRNNPNFSQYLTRRYNADHLVKSGVEAMVEDWLGQKSEGETLLDKMIYHGKKLFVLEKLLPFEKEEIIMGYTDDQLEWCQNNELEMWAYFFEKDLFYSTNANKINKLVNPSPSSSGMPPESPGRTANYLGWQIVKAFMKKNPKMSLQELIDFEGNQKLLEISKFKPRRN